MPNVIDDLSLKIKPGEYLAIVGSTGCGKSTLMRLLLGFETPQKGSIFFDNKDIARIDLESLCRKIGVVMQDGKPDEYELLSRCDGAHEIEFSPLLMSLLERGLCRVAKEGEMLSPWQREKFCDNRYFPAMNWMITGKCNYNCRHCFNAADNNRLQSEFTLEEAERLIEEAEKCGINAFTITGGEPMRHPHCAP